MATTKKQSNRGLASASAETRRQVASMGGSAYHQKRGAHGSDKKPEEQSQSP